MKTIISITALVATLFSFSAMAAVDMANACSTGQQRIVIYVDGNNQPLIVTPDQLLLTSDGTLVRAAQLVPGYQLIDPSGKVVNIENIKSVCIKAD